MSYQELMSNVEYSEENYNWSKLRKKYLNSDFPSEHSQIPSEQKSEKQYKKYRKGLSFEQIANLHTKEKNLRDFIASMSNSCSKTLRKGVIDHCQKVKVNIGGGLSSESIMKLVKNRVEKMIKNKRIKKNWSQEDLKILIWVMSKYADMNGISNFENGLNESDWEYIANLIPGCTGRGCMFKWLSLKKNNLAENSWIEEQSLLLDFIVKKSNQQNWCLISEQLYALNTLPNKVYRCPKQCREHWNCYLNPNLKKGPWCKSEDILLLKSVKQLNGCKKWAQIVKLFDGRTENALKNRFNLIIEKELKELKHGKKKVTELQLIEKYLEKWNANQYALNPKTQKSLKNIVFNKKNIDEKNFEMKKIVEYDKDEDEYIPEKPIKKKKTIIQIMKKEPEIFSHQIGDMLDLQQKPYLQESNLHFHNFHDNEGNKSCININLSKEEEQIFEEEQYSNIFIEEHSLMKEESHSIGNQKMKSSQNIMEIEGQNANITSEENLAIDASKVKLIQYSPQILQKLRNDLTMNKFNFIPCMLNPNNCIVSYPQISQ